MPDALFIGLDLGTTGVKVGAFDAAGRPLASAWRETHLDTPAPGFAEFDADRYAEGAFDAIREVLAAPGVDRRRVAAIGLSSQAQTFVVVGADGKPLRPAVSWLDVRAKAETEELVAIARRIGHTAMNAVQSAPKFLWLRRHEPAMCHRLLATGATRGVGGRLFVIPDYLIFRLTGCAVTDSVFASSTGLYDVWNGRWIPDLLEACGLTETMLPEVRRPGEVAGRLTRRAAEDLGLSEEVLVAVGTNDQPAGALGAGNVTVGCASLALGTALALVATTDRRDNVPAGVGVSPHPASPRVDGPGALYALLAYAKTAGIVVRWFRDTFAPGTSYDDLFRELATVPIGAEGLTCLPHFSGTATPDFNPAVRGAFAGLTLGHGRRHLARALAEALAFTVRENLDLLARAVPLSDVRAIGGGAKSDVWLQMIADATARPIVRPLAPEAAVLGAAVLAMVAAGQYASVAEASRAVYRPGRRFEPAPALRGQYEQAFARYQALMKALYGEHESAR